MAEPNLSETKRGFRLHAAPPLPLLAEMHLAWMEKQPRVPLPGQAHTPGGQGLAPRRARVPTPEPGPRQQLRDARALQLAELLTVGITASYLKQELICFVNIPRLTLK